MLAGAQTYWTRGVVDALAGGGLYGLVQFGEQCGRELMEEVMLVRGQLRPLERATIGALVVLDVHARDVVAEMIADKVWWLAAAGWGAGCSACVWACGCDRSGMCCGLDVRCGTTSA